MSEYHATEVRLRNLEAADDALKAFIDKQAETIVDLLRLNEALNARVDALARIVRRVDDATARCR